MPMQGTGRYLATAMLVSAAALTATAACAASPPNAAAGTVPDTAQVTGPPASTHVLLIVWDGLRPDLISAADTPNLLQLREQGVDFTAHHAVYPTLTMINAAGFATGAFPGTHGFFGNWIWAPRVSGRDSADHIVDFQQPVFTEDYAILQDLDAAAHGQLLRVPTLFEQAQHSGIATAAVGKGGPTFLQSRTGDGILIDDKTVRPRELAIALSKASLPLPRLWAKAYASDAIGALVTPADPTAGAPVPKLKDGITPDPTREDAAPFEAANAYHTRVFLDYVLPQLRPRLALLWLRNPDGTEHSFGPGSQAARRALRANDALLGALLQRLDMLGLRASTDLIIASDHGHSYVSGPLAQFPLRRIEDGAVGAADSDGFAVSGDVRTADLMRRSGLLAYDGSGPVCDPVMSGIRADGSTLYPHAPGDAAGRCTPESATTGDYAVPVRPPLHRPYAVIAPDGGSEYLYLPSHDPVFARRVVRFLQSHEQYGPVFVDAHRYGELPGTIPLRTVHLQCADGSNPDIIVSYSFNADSMISGVPGIENSSGSGIRGMHGSFSPRDVHNVLIAVGPEFKSAWRDAVPSANVDVAPTIAALLHLRLPRAEGRVLSEALRSGPSSPRFERTEILRPGTPAANLAIAAATDVDGGTIDASATHYTIELTTQLVRDGARQYRYFDSARAVRY